LRILVRAYSRVKKKPKARLQDIAERANLSISAVSLALRDHPSISDASKARVEQIRQELGYRTSGHRHDGNPHGKTNLNIGYCLVGESLQDEAYTPIAHGIIQACRQWQAHLAIEQIPASPLPSEPVTMPNGVVPHGYILVGVLTDEMVEHFSSDGKPSIIIGSNPLKGNYSRVSADVYQAGKMVAKRAIDEGYKNFVNIAANLDALHNIQFLNGARHMLESHGLSLPENQVIIASEYSLHEPQYLNQLAEISKSPTAILIAGAVTATACASVLHAKGWMSENKFSIYALRQSDVGKINPHYKALNLGFERLGQIAVDRLVQKVLNYATYQDAYTSVVSAEGWLDMRDSSS